MRIVLLAGIAGLISSSAFAASPHPTAQDADGDGSFVSTMDVNGDGAKDAKDIGVKASAYDCDDGHKSIHPGATEVVGDGTDQDCNGSDLTMPVTDVVWKRFIANEYKGRAPSVAVFAAEYARVTAASSRMSIDAIDGKFKVSDPDVDAFRDIYIGTSKVLGTDGIREIVTLEEASHFRGGSASGGGGVSTKTVIKLADKSAEKAVKVETEARLKWQVEREGELAGITQAVNTHGEDIEKNAEAIEAEAEARADADEVQDRDIKAAKDAADGAVSTANSMASRGTLIEGYALAGALVGSPVTDDDDFARQPLGGGVGAGINIGADLEESRVNAFVDAFIGGDGGAGPAHSEAVGIEIVPDDGILGIDRLGGFLAYSQRSSQPNALETQVLGRNPLIGISYVSTFSPNAKNGAHGLFQVRLGVGPEFLGIAGDHVSDEVGVAGRLTIAIGGGIGALK